METETSSEAKLHNATHALKFLLAGNATFTVRSVKTGTRFTYKVKRICCADCKTRYGNGTWPEKKHSPCSACPCHVGNGRYFVSLLTGPNNEQDYQYIGMLIPSAMTPNGQERVSVQVNEGVGYRFSTTRTTRVVSDAPSIIAVTWLLAHLCKGNLPNDVEVWHAGTCGRCGRKLTVPESIAIGIGPECLSREGL